MNICASEKVVPNVDYGEMVIVQNKGGNVQPIIGVVTENDSRCCTIDIGKAVRVFESKDGKPHLPEIVPRNVYIFGDINRADEPIQVVKL